MHKFHIETLYRGNAEDVEDFRCSDEPMVEEFLKEHALKLQEQGMVTTKLVYSMKANLLGYYSLFCSNIPKLGREKINKEGWDLPLGEKYYPSIRLHYLGVDERVRGRRIGEQVCLHAVNDCLKIRKLTGCVFVTVEALNSSVGFYERQKFVSIGRQYNFINMAFRLRGLE